MVLQAIYYRKQRETIVYIFFHVNLDGKLPTNVFKSCINSYGHFYKLIYTITSMMGTFTLHEFLTTLLETM